MDSETLFLEGVKSEEGLGVAKDYDKAFQFYLQAADQNYAPAQNSLALMYWFGKGTPKNLEKTIEYFQKAVKHNNLMACCHLARLYEDGFIKETDLENRSIVLEKVLSIDLVEPKKSSVYYQEQLLIYHLEKQWKSDCQLKMGCHLLKKQSEKAIPLLMELASPEAMFLIGVHSENTKNEKKAFQYYQKAAQSNYQEALKKVAFCYETGFGTEINLIECLKWFRKAKMEKEVERVIKDNWDVLSHLLLK